MGVGPDPGHFRGAAGAAGADGTVVTGEIHPPFERQPAELRSVRNRLLEQALLSARNPRDDGAGAAVRVSARARGRRQPEDFFRRDDRRRLLHAEQAVRAYRHAQYLAADRRGGAAESGRAELCAVGVVLDRAALVLRPISFMATHISKPMVGGTS